MKMIMACVVMIVVMANSAYAGPLFAPSKRSGPVILEVVEEPWNGYDSYDGYFWTYHGLRWTQQEIDNFRGYHQKGRPPLEGVYEFRRVGNWYTDMEGGPASEHWDGAWGRDECFWFIFCISYQAVYTEYITSLPRHDNKGVEEYDGWWSSGHALSLLGPPARYFDWCDAADWLAGKRVEGVCDEEYEIAFDPYQLVKDRYYYTAIKFRTDRDDGTDPTKWQVEFEVHEQSFNPFIPYYANLTSCTTDRGVWEIDFAEERGYHDTPSNIVSNCVDFDADGVVDSADICPQTYDPNQLDEDGDGIGDACDVNPAVHVDDLDADGKKGDQDNCPQVFNPGQEDADGDGYGDACDDDDDDDGVFDAEDAFPLDPGEWMDTDRDGIGNNADDDDDGDGYDDLVELNAGSDPLNGLSVPPDHDGDFIPDNLDDDDDNDGVLDNQDAFPLDSAEQQDTDGDGVGNNADGDDDGDLFIDTVEIQVGTDPLDPGSTPPDHDGDLIPDVLDPDDDNDGIPDSSDAFPFDPVESVDTDGDGMGDNEDTDDDNDGYSDAVEISQGTDRLDPSSHPADHDGDFIPDSIDTDDDNDGVPDASDAFPLNASEWLDTDGDGIGDNTDTDDDNDCFSDELENSMGSDPLNPTSMPPDNDGDCNPDSYDPDDDNDGVEDSLDAFPFDPSEWLDSDGDGVGNNTDTDDDNDGMPDSWETTYGLNPILDDDNLDADFDRYSNWQEYQNGTIPDDACSPIQLEICFYYGHNGMNYAQDSSGNLDPTHQCGTNMDGALGVHCIPLDDWSPTLGIDTDGRPGGCQQRFSLRSQCDVELTLCVDFQVTGGGDGGQCINQGSHCAAINEWTDPIIIDTDNRNGGCFEQFSISGDAGYYLDLNFWPDGDAGQCRITGESTASSTTGKATYAILIDADDRNGGCGQEFRVRNDVQYTQEPTPIDGYSFCGGSTYASCASDGDCEVGGCSSQICKGVGESMMSTCEVRDCNNANRFGIRCGCEQNRCAWVMP